MNTKSWVFACLVCTVATFSARPAHAAGCEPAGGAQFICGLNAPEDLIGVPNTDWVLVSSMGEGKSHLYAVDAKSHTPTALFPAAGAREQWDKKTYASCPGPLPTGSFAAHGVDLRMKARGKGTVFLVNHGGRESIEVFELDATGRVPSVTWVGCVAYPDHASGNGVVGLADGGFITTNFHDPKDKDAFQKMGAKQITGNVLEWRPSSGWSPLPDSAASGPNGIVLSSDGKWLYVAGWSNQEVVRFERTRNTWTKRDTIPIGILTDNLRWMNDGSLLAAGQDTKMPDVFACRAPACHVGSAGVKIDPRTLKTTRLVTYAGNDSFEGGTTVLEVGNEYWIGSYKGDKIARLPVH
jgi:sugar lactone lactonase YvrE